MRLHWHCGEVRGFFYTSQLIHDSKPYKKLLVLYCIFYPFFILRPFETLYRAITKAIFSVRLRTGLERTITAHCVTESIYIYILQALNLFQWICTRVHRSSWDCINDGPIIIIFNNNVLVLFTLLAQYIPCLVFI